MADPAGQVMPGPVTNRLSYVDRYLRDAGRIRWDPETGCDHRLDPAICRMLHVVAGLETDTAISARQARALGIDRDADIATFLPLWADEEAEHARAIRAVLARQQYSPPDAAPVSISRRRRLVAHLPLQLVHHAVPASLVFLTLGAAAEYVTIVVYTELAGEIGEGSVTRLLRDVSHQEGRHMTFFLAGARARAHSLSRANSEIARRALRVIWDPPGVPSYGLPAWRAAFAPLLERRDIRSRVERMDRVVDSIPHLDGLHLMQRFLRDVPA